MLVDKWSIELKEGDGQSNSFVFSGRGLQLQLSPKKRIEMQQDKTTAPILTEELSISTSNKKHKKEQKQEDDTDLLNSIAFVDEVFTSPLRKKLHESSLILELSQFFFREVQCTADNVRSKNMMYGCLDIVPGAPIQLPDIASSPSPTSSSTSSMPSTPPPLSPISSSTSLTPSDKIVRIKIVHRWTKLSQPASTHIDVAIQVSC